MPRTSVIIKNAKSEIIRPMIDAMMVFLALSTFDLSPPEVIQRIPPQIKKNRAIKAAAMRRIVITAERTGPILFAFKLHNPLKPDCVGHGLILICAKAGRASVK